MPRGVYSRSFGEASPAMLELKATLEAAQAKVTVTGAAELIREVLGYVERTIQHELRRDEELKDPR